MTRLGKVVVAVLALGILGACGGGTPSDGDAQRVLSDFVARAGAATSIAPCDGLTGGRGEAAPVARERTLPKLRLACLGGGEAIALQNLRGPLLLNVWASWCGPCKEELPYLLEAREAFGERVRFAAIAIADSDEDSRRWMSFHGVTWPSLADPDSRIRGPLRIPGPPVTLFVRSNGTVAGSHYGAFTGTAQVREEIRTYLGLSAQPLPSTVNHG